MKGVRDIKFYHIVQVDQLLNRSAHPTTLHHPFALPPSTCPDPPLLCCTHRFAEDAKCGKVSSKMALLLLNSYFPQGPEVTGAKQVRPSPSTPLPLPSPSHTFSQTLLNPSLSCPQVARCLTFLRQSKGAALAFYSRLRDHVSLSTVVKLAAMLLRCVFTAALKEKAAQPQVQNSPTCSDSPTQSFEACSGGKPDLIG